jgi:hypothetical protein
VLARQALYHVSNTSNPFSFTSFIESYIYAWAGLDIDTPIYHSCLGGMTGTPPNPAFISWNGVGVLPTFCLVWWILPISASQVVRITGMSHCARLLMVSLSFYLRYWDLNSRPWATQPALFLCWVFSRYVPSNYLLRLALNLDLPDLCLLSS